MSDVTHAGRGDLVLTVLRFAILATASTLVGVLAHVIWKAVTQ